MEQNDMPMTTSSTSSDNSHASQTSQTAHGFADRARDLAGSAQDKLADVGSTVRDRTGDMKDKLADALETGADKVRSATSSSTTGSSDSQLATANGASAAVMTDGAVAQAGSKVAGGMEATADWLRDMDLDGLKTGLEDQVKNHPGRTLLIAAGVGYLLGKALKK